MLLARSKAGKTELDANSKGTGSKEPDVDKELTRIVPQTNVRYQIRSSFRGNRGLPTSIWLRYEYKKYVSNRRLKFGPVMKKFVTSRHI